MTQLPIEIIGVISNFSDFMTKIKLTRINRAMHENYSIINLFDIPNELKEKIDQKIIENKFKLKNYGVHTILK